MFHYFKKFSAWLFPYTCIFCKNFANQSYDLCHACWKDLPILTHGCMRCANILPSSHPNLLCGDCLKDSPAFDTTHALFMYRPPITKLMLDLKFYHALANARLLGELLATKIQTEWYQHKPMPTAIIPMPLHQARLKERGFNQALEIARPISNALNIPLLTTHCVRHKATLAQTYLSALERKQNIRHAFSIKKPWPDKHIAVVDDVITTGSTLREFCRVLKKSGVQQIDVWCCARSFYTNIK